MQTSFKSVTWRILSYLMLFILVFGPLASFSAQASSLAQEAEPNSPAAPGDHLVTDISLTPDSPNILRTNEDVSLSFNYVTNDPSGVRIFVRPFTNGSLTPNYSAHGSSIYPTGSGQGSGFFTITSGEVVVDQIRIRMTNADQSVVLFEAFLPVYYLFTDAAHAVTHISLTPDTPDVLPEFPAE